MADVKIADLVAYTTPIGTDVMPVVDVTNDLTKKVSVTSLLGNAPVGSAASPSISFAGDSNTGIFRPGADQVAITTGGTQRLLIEDSGVTVPGNLTVSGTTTTIDTTTLVVEDKNIEIGKVSTPSDTTADGGGITLKGATDKTITWVNSTDCWTFNQSVDVGGNVRIDSSGNVGIGTSSPETIAHVFGPNPVLRIQDSSTSIVDAFAGIQLAESVSGGGLGNYWQIALEGDSGTSADHLTFKDGTGERMRIDSDGRLMVGATTPPFDALGAKLQVVASSTASLVLARNDASVNANQDVGSIRFFSNDGGTYQECARIAAEAEGNYANNDKPTFLSFWTTADSASSPTERLRIDSSGRVGIGTTSPDAPLQVGVLDSPGTLRGGLAVKTISNGLGNSEAALYIEESSGGEGYYLRVDSVGGLAFDNSAATPPTLYLGDANNVGIGTSSPAEPLHIANTVPLIRFEDTNNSNALLDISGSGGDCRIDIDPTGLFGSSRFSVDIDGTERMRIDTTGRLLVGTSSAVATDSDSKLQVVSTGNPKFILARNDTSVANNQSLGNILWYGNDSNGTFQQCASINAIADANHGTGDKPTALTFATTADGASSPTERLRIDSSGDVLIGGTLPSSPNIKLSSNGLVDLKRPNSGGTYGDGTRIQFNTQGSSSGSMGEAGEAFVRFRKMDASGNLTDVAGIASDGSITAAGSVNVPGSTGDGDGVNINPNGQLAIRRDDTTATAFQISKGVGSNNRTIRMLSDGSITAAGQIESQATGFKFPDGTVQATAASGGIQVGTAPNETPLNQFLGQQAFLDEVGTVRPSATEPQDSRDINFEYVSDTSIKIRMRGDDGTVRSTTLTLS